MSCVCVGSLLLSGRHGLLNTKESITMDSRLNFLSTISTRRRTYRKIHLIFFLTFVYLASTGNQNLTEWSKSREKRYLIWANSGSTKLGLSISIPVNLYDKKKWRTFNMIFNYGFNYDMPHHAHDWLGNFNYWQMSRSSEPRRTFVQPDEIDLTGMYIYAVLENYMTNSGVNGRQCMQRAICENAQVLYDDDAHDFAEKIYQQMMTPEESSEEYYKDAYIEGTKGVDCLQTYSKCPIGDSFLDNFVQYQ
ncbi:uncharacterized protein LOC129915026 [Episyrphus balteatus]|uniref:uncharacterized protein LOC129915026 n=1 Tax=Episyrphus balteatus TaxID=286459 RepID=UPI002485DE75|nr:uncharacterized protein LOC129915026 [Episyrphus balteatus]